MGVPLLHPEQHNITQSEDDVKLLSASDDNLTGIYNVLNSISQKHVIVLQELARLQMHSPCDEFKGKTQKYVQYSRFQKQCRVNMHVPNELRLSSLLKELIDHKFLQKKRHEKTGVEIVCIPFPFHTLKAIVEFKKT